MNACDGVAQESTQKFYTVLQTFRTGKNFGRLYFRALFLSQFTIVRNFLQVMYSE